MPKAHRIKLFNYKRIQQPRSDESLTTATHSTALSKLTTGVSESRISWMELGHEESNIIQSSDSNSVIANLVSFLTPKFAARMEAAACSQLPCLDELDFSPIAEFIENAVLPSINLDRARTRGLYAPFPSSFGEHT